jgi:PKD repeat protein
MKRRLLCLSLSCLCTYSFAQTQLPNTNMEDWTVADNGRDSLKGWSSSNIIVINPVISLRKESTTVFQGSNAAKVTTAPFGFVQYSTIGVLVNGAATFSYGGGGGGANVEFDGGGGTPIAFKPTSLKGYYKYETQTASDNGLARVLLTKYNTTSNKRDTVSMATFNFVPQANYTAFTIPLPDQMPGTIPDTITTIFYSSNPATVPPMGAFSDLFLDSLTLNPSLKPVANFTANVTTGNTNTQVNFTDMSTNTPTAWQWTFTPNTVAYQGATTATSTNPSVKFTAAGTYTVKMRVTNIFGADSMTKTGYIQISGGGTGIDDVAESKVLPVYPNPAKDRVFLPAYCKGAAVEVVDIYGRVVTKYEKLPGNEIDLSVLNDGFYFIRAFKEGDTWAGKLLIRK